MNPNQVERLISALDRIAVALESNSETKTNPTSDILFPVHRLGSRGQAVFDRLKTESVYKSIRGDYPWPITCKNVMLIGCRQISQIRHCGKTTSNEIGFLLESLGFPNWRHS